jgi:epoxyqueuosine reductase
MVSTTPTEMHSLTLALKAQAREQGFELAGVVLAAEPGRLAHLYKWLDEGFAANMLFMEDRREAYQHPRHVLEGCRSLLMLGLPYVSAEHPRGSETLHAGEAHLARYARGAADYHDVIHGRLKELKGWLLDLYPAAAVRGVVDTAPLLEREFAEMAGLGWVGKNTLLLNRRWGSYFFLASLLTDLELVPDAPATHSYCGTCTACLRACPTEAFPAPYVLDANRCISYLTIEHRDAISGELAGQLNNWVFGCDICQEVCPWNRKAMVTEDASMQPRLPQSLELSALLEMDEQAFRSAFRQTALWRTRRRGLVRNAILVAGTQRRQEAGPALLRLLHDDEPLVRAAAAWSLLQLGGEHRPQVAARLEVEVEPTVRERLENLLQSTT